MHPSNVVYGLLAHPCVDGVVYGDGKMLPPPFRDAKK